ncbi:hypothetical protein Taro_030353 [Colocasia esculenta]|uniref:Uncharacterized protein n=1 Tax=Colocasia esculenta TaxID=4460 RepID=A0A843W334_COLES|nr:hypothetical protein [Colocasia esculenta]
MWTFSVAVVFGGRGVDVNLRILQVLKGGWRIVERVALPNYARKCRSVVQFPWELAEGMHVGSVRVSAGVEAEDLGVNIVGRQCGTVEVCVVFLDTLTPVLELYLRLRERRQCEAWACSCVSAGVVLVGLHSCLTCSHGAAVGPFVRDCEAERLFLCCVVRVGYWPDQLVDRSRVVASFYATRALLAPVVVVVTSFFLTCFACFSCGLTRALTLAVAREFVTRGRGMHVGSVRVSAGVEAEDLGVNIVGRQCGTVEVCVVFLDTLTPVLELVLRPETLEVRVGPFVRDCEAERLFLCCVVRVGYWHDQLVDRSRVVASFFVTRALLAPVVVVVTSFFLTCFACFSCGLTRALPLAEAREFVTRGRGFTCNDTCVRYPLRDFDPFAGDRSGYRALLGISTPVRHMTSGSCFVVSVLVQTVSSVCVYSLGVQPRAVFTRVSGPVVFRLMDV